MKFGKDIDIYGERMKFHLKRYRSQQTWTCRDAFIILNSRMLSILFHCTSHCRLVTKFTAIFAQCFLNRCETLVHRMLPRTLNHTDITVSSDKPSILMTPTKQSVSFLIRRFGVIMQHHLFLIDGRVGVLFGNIPVKRGSSYVCL